MKLVRTLAITDDRLSASNAVETAPAAYNGGTTYAAGAQVSVAGSAGLRTVYESLQASNTGHDPAISPTWWTMICTTYATWASGTTYAAGDRALLGSPAATATLTIASPCVVTWSGHGLPNGTPVVLTTSGALPTGLVAGAEYYVINRTTNTFELAEAVDAAGEGDPIITAGSQSGTHTATARLHRVYQSVISSNTGNAPAIDDGTKWLDVGPTNRWACFDGAVQTQTVRMDELEITLDLRAGDRIDTLALLNIAGSSAQVTMTDAIDGVVFDQTYSLVSPSGITDWRRYLLEPISRLRDLVVVDLPPYAGATIAIIITDVGAACKCGAVVAGLATRLGGTQWGPGLGLRDYSRKAEDDFGNLVPLERPYRKRARFTVILLNSFVDELINQLADYRATPALWLGSDSYTSMAIWGFYKDFNVEVPGPARSFCSLELESLT